MLDSIARTISFIFNPLFLLLPIPYLLVMRETGEPLYALKWSVFTLMFVVCIGLFVLIAVRKKLFSDLDVPTTTSFFVCLFILTRDHPINGINNNDSKYTLP